MKKLFCDLCGKEIREFEAYAEVKLCGNMVSYDIDPKEIKKQICNKCYKEIFGKEKNEEEKQMPRM